MITTKQIKTALETDSIIRESQHNAMFWYNDNKTRFIVYSLRWGWVVHHDSLFSGKGETLDEALAILDLEKLAFDLL